MKGFACVDKPKPDGIPQDCQQSPDLSKRQARLLSEPPLDSIELVPLILFPSALCWNSQYADCKDEARCPYFLSAKSTSGKQIYKTFRLHAENKRSSDNKPWASTGSEGFLFFFWLRKNGEVMLQLDSRVCV